MTEKQGVAKKSGGKSAGSGHKMADDRDAVIARLNDRIAALEARLLTAREELQAQQEELEVQAEELEAHLEELNAANETLENEALVRRQSEEALRKSQYILAKSQEMAHVGNWAWNVTTGEMKWSDESFRIFGYLPDRKKTGWEWMVSRIHLDDRALLTDVSAAVRDGKRKDVDIRVHLPDGNVRYINVLADKVARDKAGEVRHAYGIFQDITERKRAEEALKEAKTQAELYLDLMGHDISNMHQIALSQLELVQEILLEAGRIDAADVEMIVTPIETLQRSAKLIDNVRKLQKLRAGEYRIENVDLGLVLADVVGEHTTLGNGVTINYARPGDCLVKANPLIKEAFANLVSNAIKHSSGKTTIDVGVSQVSENSSTYYRIAISDNGPGIPDDRKGEIFHRFKRGQTHARGTGLGLYIVKTLIENFGGSVRVENRVPDDYTKGSKFIVNLPVAENYNE